MSDTTEWIEEQALADLLKVERVLLRRERPHLLAGEVSTSAKNGAVIWHRTAAVRVTAKLGLALPPEEPPPQKTAPNTASELPEGVELVAVISQALNPIIVNARRDNGEKIAVRVVSNKKYVPFGSDGQPMRMPVRKATAGNWWDLAGREPRWRGKF